MIKETSSFVESFFSTLADPAFVIELEGKVARINDIGRTTFPEVREGAHAEDLFRAIQWNEGVEFVRKCAERGDTLFQIVKDATGRSLFECTFVPLCASDGRADVVMVSVANVVGESMMDERYRLLTRVFDSISEGVLTLDLDRRLTGMNQSAATLLGSEDEEVKLKCVEEIIRFRHRKDRNRFMKAFHTYERLEMNTELILPSGRPLLCSLSLCTLREVDEFLLGYVLILRDRTDQIQMERRLIQMEKLNSLGNLVAGFAHELNNPLTSVIGFAQLLKSTHDDAQLCKELDIIHSHALRCKKIVDNLLAFARKHAPESRPVDVNEIARATYELMGYQLERKGITFRMQLSDNLPKIKADASQIQQILVNLIENGRYEMTRVRKAGALMLTTRYENNRIEIRLTDEGPGIPEDCLDKIFDPFFTTKPPGEGTGLGLSLSFGIVQEHGGHLSVRNREAGGAEFLIELPLTEEEGLEEEGESETGARVGPNYFGKGKKVLVVDDEKDVCSLIHSFLTRHGIEVKAAGGVREAMEELDGTLYDLVLLDYRLPDGNGAELKDAITRQWPLYEDRILYITGDAIEEDGSKLHPLQTNFDRVITKPFNLHSFVMRVSEAIADSSTWKR